MPISNGTASLDKAVFYTETYKVLIRSQRELLLRRTTDIPLDEANVRYAFRYDFYRLLRTKGIQPHLYWTIAFLNGVTDPNQDISHMRTFKNINEQELATIIARTNTRQA